MIPIIISVISLIISLIAIILELHFVCKYYKRYKHYRNLYYNELGSHWIN